MMKPAWESWTAFTLVASLHIGIIGFVIWSPSSSPKPLELPVIQGVFIPAPPAEQEQVPMAKAPPKPVEQPPEPKPKPPKPKPKPKPLPKPKPKPKPPVELPPSEKAITRDIEEEEQVEQETLPPPSPNAPVIAEEDKLGATVTPPRHDAAHLNNPQPGYPNISRRMREEGTVILEVLILPDGSVGEVKLKQSSGYRRLDDTALNAVKRWRYVPARRGGQAIEYWYEQPIEFTLH